MEDRLVILSAATTDTPHSMHATRIDNVHAARCFGGHLEASKHLREPALGMCAQPNTELAWHSPYIVSILNRVLIILSLLNP